MKRSKETVRGWVLSLVVHLLLLLILFLIDIPSIVQSSEFVEISWGTALDEKASPPAPAAEVVSQPEPKSARMVERQKSAQPVVLPERRLPDPTDDVLRIPRAEKQETFERTPQPVDRSASARLGERSDRPGREIGEGEKTQPGTGREIPQESPSGTGVGGHGSGVDQGVSFSIQWLEGGTRRKVAGDLPQYPEGVNVEAQIKIQAVVRPDGSVKAVQPLQKGHTKLEDAAMKELRFWRFEPLRSAQLQVEQPCVVTFLFRLE
jgi:TonB family protein